ncbi:MAG: hypothetical protein ACR2M6_02565 [Vampirovibrionia bacterium]
MSEDKKEQVEATEEQSDLLEILNKLVPPDTIEIIDIFGNTYKRASVLSARKQIKVVREFEKVIAHISESDFNVENNSQIVDFLIKSATDEKVLEHMSICFGHAFPNVVERSVSYAIDEKIELDNDFPILDVFSLEDIVGAIVPLFIRLAKKLSGAISSLTKM